MIPPPPKYPRCPKCGRAKAPVPDDMGECLICTVERGAREQQDLADAVQQQSYNDHEWRIRQARAWCDGKELEAARGPRIKRTGREYAKVEPPALIIDKVLAAEVNLLGGPTGAGKSLLARDWALHVASGEPWRSYAVPGSRDVLYIASEGTHDFCERWTGHPLWERAADRIWMLDEPMSLTSADDVGWLLKEYAAERPGLVVFDVIYAMGMTDDNGVKDVAPVITAMKKISAQWGAATLALGHPGHGGERRFRGTSMWRQLAATEWHMAGGSLTCEKSKIAHAASMAASYATEYPGVRWLTSMEKVGQEAERYLLIRADIKAHPADSTRARASRLMKQLGVGQKQAERIIGKVIDDDAKE